MKLTLDRFFAKYNGRYVDYDGHYGCQCVDLLRQYLKECLGLNPYTLPPVAYAKQVFQNFDPKNPYFVKVLNGPTNVPKRGDIVVWGFYPFVTGIAGHVAIFDRGDMWNFITFDQNYPTGSPCHFQRHNYRGVLGWLSPK